jgi:hypothetical protein
MVQKNKSYSKHDRNPRQVGYHVSKVRTFFLHSPFSSRLFYREYFSESLSAVKTASCLKGASSWASFS